MKESLKAICADRIAEYIADGLIYKFAKKPSPKLSNQIFKQLIHYSNQRWHNSHFRIRDILNVTEFCYYAPYLDHHICALAYDQDLESLELGNLRSWSIIQWQDDLETETEAAESGEKEMNEESQEENQGTSQNEELVQVEGDPHQEETEEDDYDDEVSVTADYVFQNAPTPNQQLVYDERLYVVDVDAMLDKFLNPTSKQKLKSLTIIGDNMIPCAGWIESLAEKLPSLESLSIKYTALTEEDFQDLCNNFERLKRLDITYACVYSLKGISKLKNLLYLNISKLTLDSKEDIEELFELQNLRHLVIADDDMRTGSLIENYLACDKTLPELRYLDCSFTQLTDKQLEKLYNTHGKLEVLGVIGTQLEGYLGTQNNGRLLKLLSIGSLAHSLDTLEFYISTKQQDTDACKRCILGIDWFLLNCFDEYPQKDIKRAQRLLCSYKPTVAQNMNITAKCLFSLVKFGHAAKLTLQERYQIIGYLLDTLPKWEQGYEKRLYGCDVLVILCEDILLHASPESRYAICSSACVYMLNEISIQTKSLYECFSILCRYLTPEQARSLINMGVAVKILQIISSNDFSGDYARNFHEYLDMVAQLYNIRGKDDWAFALDYECLQRMSSLLPVFEKVEIFQEHILITLASIVVKACQHAVMGVLTEQNFIEIAITLYSQNTSKKQLAMFLLVSIYYCVHTNRFDTLPKGEDTWSSMNVLVLDMRDALKNYVDTPELGYLDGLEYALTRVRWWQTEEVISWYHKLYMDLLELNLSEEENVEDQQ
uniref:Cnd3 domain-containing protein n=1 Tax=Caenorhabditis tropicalis TaxID=1561998 RepID=A0A1I7T4A0_9PELO